MNNIVAIEDGNEVVEQINPNSLIADWVKNHTPYLHEMALSVTPLGIGTLVIKYQNGVMVRWSVSYSKTMLNYSVEATVMDYKHRLFEFKADALTPTLAAEMISEKVNAEITFAYYIGGNREETRTRKDNSDKRRSDSDSIGRI